MGVSLPAVLANIAIEYIEEYSILDTLKKIKRRLYRSSKTRKSARATTPIQQLNRTHPTHHEDNNGINFLHLKLIQSKTQYCYYKMVYKTNHTGKVYQL